MGLGTTAAEQLRIMTSRNLLMKSRLKRVTLCEILTPVIFFSFLFILKASLPDANMAGNDQSATNFTLDVPEVFLQAGLPPPEFRGQLLYAPNDTDSVNDLMELVANNLEDPALQSQIVGLEDENALIEQYKSDNDPNDPTKNVWLSLFFEKLDADNLDYQIRMNGSRLQSTSFSGFTQSDQPQGMSEFQFTGFCTAQLIVNNAYLQLFGTEDTNLAIDTQAFPTRPTTNNIFRDVVLIAGSIYLVFGFLPITVILTSFIVQEKEWKVKEIYHMMGLRRYIYYLSYHCVYLLLVLLPCGVMTILAEILDLLGGTNSFWLFLPLFLYAQSLVPIAFVISVFFDKAKTAAMVATIIPVLLFAPQFALTSNTSNGAVLAASLSPPIAFATTFNTLFDSDIADDPISLSNFGKGPNSAISYGTGLLMLLADTFIFWFLTIYLENTIQGSYGQSRGFLYCFRAISDFFKGMRNRGNDERRSSLISYGAPSNGSQSSALNVEPVEADVLEKGKIVIRNLDKVFANRWWNFGGGEKKDTKAVNGLNLTCYQDQILALLGHNGAGKSTTINMITGLLQPTSGEITVDGKNLFTNLESIQRQMGVCLQEDVNYQNIRVIEIFEFFAKLKGIPRNRVEKEVGGMLDMLGMTEKKLAWCQDLSGGQKRKMAVGLALIGDPKIVFLDEPTSGMDPYSRRKVWDVLKKFKKGRWIFLTTHFMDEADLLGDRIGIMSHGSLRCVGSSLFLKNRFGIGYHLVMSMSKEANRDEVITAVQKCVPKASVNTNIGQELEFLVPTDDVSEFIDLFSMLEENQNIQLEEHERDDDDFGKYQGLGILEYGVSLTTLEEVFLRIAEAEEEEENDDDYMDADFVSAKSEKSWAVLRPRLTAQLSTTLDSTENALDNVEQFEKEEKKEKENPQTIDKSSVKESLIDLSVSPLNPGELEPSWLRQMSAMFRKRILMAKRDPRSLFVQFVFPALYVVLLLAVVVPKKGVDIVEPPTNNVSSAAFQQIAFEGAPLNIFGPDEQTLNDTASLFTSVFDNVVTHTSTKSNILDDVIPFLQFNDTDVDPNTPPREDLPETYAAIAVNSVDLDTNQVNMTILANSSRPFAFPQLLDIVTNSFAKNSISNNARVSTTDAPEDFPRDKTGDIQAAAIVIPIYICVIFGYVPLGLGILLIKERICKAKHLQFVMGTPAWVYWLSNLIVDLIGYAVVIIFVFVMFALFGQTSIIGANTPAAAILFFVCAVGTASLTYVFTFLFEKHDTFRSAHLFIITFGSIGLFFVVFGVENFDKTASALAVLFSVMPTFSIAYGLRTLILLDSSAVQNDVLDAFAWDITGRHIVITSLMCFIFWGFVVAKDMGFEWLENLLKPSFIPEADPPPEYQDDDVTKEREKVRQQLQQMDANKRDSVLVSNLYKAFKIKRDPGEGEPFLKAVNDVSFSIPNGECFGLLGPNGAGKTTTISILTCDVVQDGGRAWMAGRDVSSERQEVFQNLGFCPQFNGLHDLLTGTEHLEMYARVKGVKEERIPELVKQSLTDMDLLEYASRSSVKYSGGNKRKLNTAIALLAAPKVVVLDEPSTGMDPVTRRKLWEFIANQMKDRVIILTTHSMEEADVLCTRIGIMVNGTMRCLGSSQHLKSVHGSGYQIELRTAVGDSPSAKKLELISEIKQDEKDDEKDSENKSEETIEEVKHFVEDLLGDFELLEEFGGRLRYSTPNSKISLAKLFKELEGNKDRLKILDYSISQPTLEQVFIRIASDQREEYS